MAFEEEAPTLSKRKQNAFDASLEGRKTRKERNVFTRTKFTTRVKEANEMRQSGEWERATAQHFVALYAILHKLVYEIEPLELNDTVRTKAVIMASQCLKKHFNGDSSQMAMFMDYVWTKEKSREKWRRDNQREGGRIGWYRQFDGSLVTDWIADARRKGKPL